MTEEKRKGLEVHPIKDAIMSAIRDTGHVYTAAVDNVSLAVRNTLAAAKRAGSSAIGAVTHVVLEAIRGALEMGSDLTQAGKGIVVGVLHGSGDRSEGSLRTIVHTARTVIHHTAMTGCDVTSATTGLVEGAIQCAEDTGVNVTRAASAAAEGALEGAEEVSYAATEQVRVALRGHFPGVRILLLPPYQEQER
jgi:hypothetical protein